MPELTHLILLRRQRAQAILDRMMSRVDQDGAAVSPTVVLSSGIGRKDARRARSSNEMGSERRYRQPSAEKTGNCSANCSGRKTSDSCHPPYFSGKIPRDSEGGGESDEGLGDWRTGVEDGTRQEEMVRLRIVSPQAVELAVSTTLTANAADQGLLHFLAFLLPFFTPVCRVAEQGREKVANEQAKK